MQKIDVIFEDQSLISLEVYPETTVRDIIQDMIKKSEERSINVFSKNISIDDICLMYNSAILSSSEKLYSFEHEAKDIKKQYSCFINPTLGNEVINDENDSIPLSKKVKLANACVNSKGELIMKQNDVVDDDEGLCQQMDPFISILILLGFSFLMFL